MLSDWCEFSLSEISDRIGDGLHGTPTYSENGDYYFINGNNLESGEITIKESTKKVDYEQYEKHKKELTLNSLLVSINGTIGNVALYNGEEVVLGKSACYINLKNDVHRDFVAYVLSSHQFQEYIQRCATGSTIKNVSLKMMREFTFKMPSEEQDQVKAVAALKNLDRKIRINNQNNQTLEQMAQALFKSWFVDFDPVIDNALAAGNLIPDELQARAELRQRVIAERATNPKLKPLPDDIQQLFPSEFEDSELGWIPKGWSLSKLGELIDFATGPAFKSKDFVDDGVKLARGDNVKEGFFHWGTKARYWPSITSELEKYSLAVGDILIGMDGSKVGKNWVQVSDSDLPSLLIQRVARLRSKGMIGSAYLSVLISSDRFKNYVDLVKTGTSIPHISGGQIKSLVILNPNDNHRLFQKFEEVLAPFSLKNSKIKSEIITLISLRDILLPKLISGEIQLGPKAQEPFNA
jgi:type I restriction enzyme S subunit